ncbi:MAG: hypothetical protein H0T89_28270 [Deltaproteobacteria bacterium]|nr:hypothetical protein [Deltaproteobacteria bacterium]MDQ3296113.1 hypothetical protein [Myxococcota bacterium]
MNVLLVVVIAMLAACGGTPPIPKRGVVEGDLGSWKFRRFQPVLDVEVWVEGNKAEAYTASYVTEAAEKRGRVEDHDIVNVFVTRYERPDGVLRETVKLARRLAAEQGYQVDETRLGGARTLSITGNGEAWIMWPAKGHVVKIGGRGRDSVPAAMVESYADRYPSQLPGGSLEGPLPPGPDSEPRPVDQPAHDPDNPRPDLDKYDPKAVKIPERAVAPPDAPAEPSKPTKRDRKPKP